jgi:hypothetical protein
MKNFSFPILILNLLILTSCGFQVRNDCACGFYTDASGKKLMHWPDGSQIELSLHRDFPEIMVEPIEGSAAAYNSVLAQTQLSLDSNRRDAPDFTGSTPDEVTNSTLGDGVNGLYWVNGNWPWQVENPSSDAMTLVSFKFGKIVEADVFFKGPSFLGSSVAKYRGTSFFNPDKVLTANNTDKTQLWSRLEKLFLDLSPWNRTIQGGIIETPMAITSGSTNQKWLYVLGTHELGHLLGLVHSKDKSNIMYPSVGLSFVKDPVPENVQETLKQAYVLKPTE